jgi:hypothetical protein
MSGRGYGAWHTEHPLTATYDRCDHTACEMYDSASTNSRTDAAVDATKGKVLLDQAGAIARSEYAAENNNVGCGDGKTGIDQPVAPCISDVTCKGTTRNGHGRGMCQWGSQRWAIGKDHDGNGNVPLNNSDGCRPPQPQTCESLVNCRRLG